VTVACQGKRDKSSIRYFVGFVELPCLSASLGNVTQYKVCLIASVCLSVYVYVCVCLLCLRVIGMQCSIAMQLIHELCVLMVNKSLYVS